MKQREQNQNGFTLAGLMVSVAITAVVALGAAYVLINSQNVSNFGNIQNEIDRLQYLSLQLSRNPAFILQQPGFEKGGPLYQCLQHSGPVGVDCTKLRAPASYVSTTKVPGSAQSISTSMSFLPSCSIPQACQSLTITTSTGPATSDQASGNSKLSSTLSFRPRRSVSVIPSYLLVPVTGFNFSCVLNQGLILGLNYASSQAQCQPLQGTLANLSEPLANFGPLLPTTVQTMTNQNCTAGFSSIGSFQDQVNCLAPTPTTLITMPPPSVPPTGTTLPSSPTTTVPGPGHWVYDGTTPIVAWGDSPLVTGVCGLSYYQCAGTSCPNLRSYIAGAGQTFYIGAGVGLKKYQCGGAGGSPAGTIRGVSVCLPNGAKVNRTVTNGAWICTIP